VYFAHPVKGFPLPRSVAVLDWLLLLSFVAGSRLIARSLMERPGAASLVARGKEVIVVGAGDAAQLVIREMLKAPALGYTPIGLIDDDPRKKNLRLHGIRVLGTTEELAHILRDNPPDEVLIAIPSASGETRQRVVEVAGAANVPVKTLPGLYELISGDLNLAGQIRPVQVQDVLGREPVEVDLESIASYLADETVLVTGAGGSIGSELCRQIARLGASRLVLVENSERALFEIERELVVERSFSACAAVLADVGNRRKLREVFERSCRERAVQLVRRARDDGGRVIPRARVRGSAAQLQHVEVFAVNQRVQHAPIHLRLRNGRVHMIHVPHAVKPVFIMLGIVGRHRAVVRYSLDFQIDMSYLHDPGLPFGEHLNCGRKLWGY